MAESKPHIPSLRFAAIFSQQVEAIDWAVRRASEQWGPTWLESPDFEFDQTSFYDRSMGSGLKKRLVAYEALVDPTDLVVAKTESNRWEKEFLQAGNGWAVRPLNIDPGYLTEAKVVLMTTKDRDHRLYMGDGIYAEVTLFFQLPGQWVSSRWTYPDYKLEGYHEFFFRCRDYLRQRLRAPTTA